VVIIGTVAGGREALIPLTLLGPGEGRARIEAVVDTGFTGHLVLPSALVGELGLPLRGVRDSFLADGSLVSLDAYRVGVEWDGRVRVVLALAAEGGPLLGMSLLRGSEIRIEAVDGGEVVIRPLP
jgi:clan AA aspartic protease